MKGPVYNCAIGAILSARAVVARATRSISTMARDEELWLEDAQRAKAKECGSTGPAGAFAQGKVPEIDKRDEVSGDLFLGRAVADSVNDIPQDVVHSLHFGELVLRAWSCEAAPVVDQGEEKRLPGHVLLRPVHGDLPVLVEV